jgi:CBS domain-containing protein
MGKQKVKDLMTKDPVYVTPEASLMTVADLMLRKKIKRLPVVQDGKLVGIIDRGAFFEFIMEGDLYETME